MPTSVSDLILDHAKSGINMNYHRVCVLSAVDALCHFRMQHQMWPLTLGLPSLENHEMNRLEVLITYCGLL